MTTLENSYCKPQSEAEWDLLPNRDLWCRNEDAVFGAIDFRKQKVSGKTEIPVQHFIDLIEDRIVPWRLEEIGFEYNEYRGKVLSELSKYITTENENHCIDFDPNDGIVKVNLNGFEGVETFSEILTLIKFLE